MTDPALLAARGIDKAFFGVKVLDGVDFTLHPGEIHALLGENGAGKSTLVKILTGAYRRDAGAMQLEGAEVEPRSVAEAQALGIGTVYQEVNLLENLTVAENLYLGRQPRGEHLGVQPYGHISDTGLAAGLCVLHDHDGPVGFIGITALANPRPA